MDPRLLNKLFGWFETIIHWFAGYALCAVPYWVYVAVDVYEFPILLWEAALRGIAGFCFWLLFKNFRVGDVLDAMSEFLEK